MKKFTWITIKWVLSEDVPGGWEPVEFLPGKTLPVLGTREVQTGWTAVKAFFDGKQHRIINPDGTVIYTTFTPMEVVNW